MTRKPVQNKPDPLSILDTIMVNGRPLRDVTVAEAREWAARQRAMGEAHRAMGEAHRAMGEAHRAMGEALIREGERISKSGPGKKTN